MSSINFAAIIGAEPYEIWHQLRQFGAIDKWHPDVRDCVIQGGKVSGDGGSVRTLNLHNGEVVHERLLAIDNNKMAMSYGLSSPRLLVENFSAHLQISPAADGMNSAVTWKARFDVGDQKAMANYESAIGEFILNGIQGLADHLGATVQFATDSRPQIAKAKCTTT